MRQILFTTCALFFALGMALMGPPRARKTEFHSKPGDNVKTYVRAPASAIPIQPFETGFQELELTSSENIGEEEEEDMVYVQVMGRK